MNKKGRKTAEKNVSTSFRVLQAPKSWSKYTTEAQYQIDYVRLNYQQISKQSVNLSFWLEILLAKLCELFGTNFVLRFNPNMNMH